MMQMFEVIYYLSVDFLKNEFAALNTIKTFVSFIRQLHYHCQSFPLARAPVQDNDESNILAIGSLRRTCFTFVA